MKFSEWDGFLGGTWTDAIDVRDFIQSNYTPYEGGGDFLMPAVPRTLALLGRFEELAAEETARGGVLDIDTETVASVLHFEPGYIDRENEIIVGLQTDKPLKRAVNPFGGIRMARAACEAYGYGISEKILNEFKFRTTHNDGVFHVYTDEMRAARRSGIITGLPDAYGRGRIIGDYRRLALYGADVIIGHKRADKKRLGEDFMDEENIRLSEDLWRQIDFMEKLVEMAGGYGFNVRRPAANAREAVQWVYFAYLAAIKEQNGAAMSLGRVAGFIDIYIQRDLAAGILDESGAQELIDQLVIKLRAARHLRTAEYNELFGGDPMWITEALGGVGLDRRTLVTKTTFRFLHTLYNLAPAPEPNLTVLWSQSLPEQFKLYCARVSVETDSIQYENDDIMRPIYGDDYGISCCVSAMAIGKQMQFFGARVNLPKLLLLALNGGRDEISGEQIGPAGDVIAGEYLGWEDVRERWREYLGWMCRLYVSTMNVIHYMHDKYAYEKVQMALHDTEVKRFMAFGIAGLSVLADSFSAIKYAKVKPVRGGNGLIADYIVEGEFPKYGNDDDRADGLAVEIVREFIGGLRQYPAYRGAEHTLSVLTITSNVVYGKKTGSTPDGRPCGEPFAPGANPMHGREISGPLASLNSVAKLPYECCRDGISNTFTITPNALGSEIDRADNLAAILDGYFSGGAHHLNVNVLDKSVLLDAFEHPEKYPNLTIRVSGYAVNFHKLSRSQQREVLTRTFF